jgi:hypothetical protein
MRRTSALLAAAAIGIAGVAGCGDDKEGPGEDVGEAVDEGAKKGAQELKETERDLDDGKKD